MEKCRKASFIMLLLEYFMISCYNGLYKAYFGIVFAVKQIKNDFFIHYLNIEKLKFFIT